MLLLPWKLLLPLVLLLLLPWELLLLLLWVLHL